MIKLSDTFYRKTDWQNENHKISIANDIGAYSRLSNSPFFINNENKDRVIQILKNIENDVITKILLHQRMNSNCHESRSKSYWKKIFMFSRDISEIINDENTNTDEV